MNVHNTQYNNNNNSVSVKVNKRLFEPFCVLVHKLINTDTHTFACMSTCDSISLELTVTRTLTALTSADQCKQTSKQRTAYF